MTCTLDLVLFSMKTRSYLIACQRAIGMFLLSYEYRFGLKHNSVRAKHVFILLAMTWHLSSPRMKRSLPHQQRYRRRTQGCDEFVFFFFRIILPLFVYAANAVYMNDYRSPLGKAP